MTSHTTASPFESEPRTRFEAPRPVSPRLPLSGGTSPAALDAQMRQPFRAPTEDWVVEESFAGTIEEIREDAIRLHTVSLDGEEGVAWLPLSSVPESERKYIELGAPIRIAIVVDHKAKSRKREHQVRVLRPDQWRAPVSKEGAERVTDFVLERMSDLLKRGA